MAFNLTAILLLPAAQPPPGVLITFEEDTNFTRGTLANSILCFVIAVFAFCMYMYTRLIIMRKFAIEDYLFVLTKCFYLGYMIAVFNITRHGLYHQWNLHIKNVGFYLYWNHVGEITYVICVVLLKLVILIQFVKLFIPMKRGTMYVAYQVLIWTNIGWGIATVFTLIFQCIPIRKIWDPLLLVSDVGHCINLRLAFIISPTLFLLQDIILLILPQCSIWKLNLSTHKKIGVSALFAVGIGACVASAVRLVYAIKLFQTTDQLGTIWHLAVGSTIETTCGILIAALPISPRFLQHIQGSRWMLLTKKYLSRTSTDQSSSDSQIKRPSQDTLYNSASEQDPTSTTTQVKDYKSGKLEENIPKAMPQGIIVRTRQWDVESQDEQRMSSKAEKGAATWI